MNAPSYLDIRYWAAPRAYSSPHAGFHGSLAFLIVVGLFCIVFLPVFSSPDHIWNDGAQYLSTTEQLLLGRGFRTTAVYYDIHAQSGMPAIQTVWPPGVPLVLATAVKLTGLSTVTAFAVVNAVAHALTALTMYVLLARMLNGAYLAALISLGYLLHSQMLILMLAGASEPLFTLAIVSSAYFLYRSFETPAERIRWALAASAAIGAACSFRYSGIAFLLALGIVGALSILRERFSRAALGRGVALVLPAALMLAALLIRNLIMTGRLTGGPSSPRGLSIREILSQGYWAALEQLGGAQNVVTHLAAPAFLMALAVYVTLRLLSSRRDDRGLDDPRLILAVYGFLGLVATVGMIVLLSSSKTGVVIEGRYFLPCLPLAIVSLVGFLSPRATTSPSLARATLAAGSVLAVLAAILTLGNLVNVVSSIRQGWTPGQIARLLDHRAEGQSLRDRLVASASVSHPVMSNQSQALYAALQKPTLGVPEKRLTPNAWTPEQIVDLAQRFGVEHLVIFRTLPLGASDGSDDYVLQIVERTPSTLEPLHMSETVALYRVKRQ